MTGSITILDPGFLTVLEDAGRRGWAHLGVSPSGAADRGSFASANRAVGNEADGAVLEVLLGTVTFRLDVDRWCAVAGAPAAVTVDSLAVPDPGLFRVRAGQVVALTGTPFGLRSYVAIGGGVLGDEVLGSVSHDSLSGLGTPPAVTGTSWALGEPREPDVPVVGLDRWSDDVVRIEAIWGPRDDLLDEAARAALGSTVWLVTGDSDRVGLRLDGPALDLRVGSLPSEGTVSGAVQIPPAGRPIIFLADHPASAGYPIVAVVGRGDLDRLAQCRPGDRVQFAPR